MNSDMNRDAEAFENRFFAWILKKPYRDPSVPTEGNVNPMNANNHESENLSNQPPDLPDDLDLLDTEEIGYATSSMSELEGLLSPYLENQSSPLGEMPAVQDRFYSLLKMRLETEIERNPPLFPWEARISDYPESLDSALEPLVPPDLWAAQLQRLTLPVPVPQRILAQLLEYCLEVVQSSLRAGEQLVGAVERLFPGESQALNEYAGLVLRGAGRGTLLQTDFSYETGTSNQQMLLCLLAAQKIISYLTLTLSRTQPRLERQWLTAVGLLNLEAEYGRSRYVSSLRLQVQLPCGGSLHFQGSEDSNSENASATAQRLDPGWLSVELFDPQPHQVYPLEVQFLDLDQEPLIFAIVVQ